MEMKRSSYVLPFVAILAAHLLAVTLFTRGFLLTRTELPVHSNCSDASHSPCSQPPDPSACWTRPAARRLVLVVFDALRFDFVAPSAFFHHPLPWMDKLTLPQRLAARPSARLFKSIADPPTTSLQRLKGLTTGGLPTFIDIGNSFGAPAIVEDNLIHQLVSNGKKILMMGDDTWIQLFPDHFHTSHPYPSFNVKDLDTVDDGCIEHLFPSLLRDDWDVLIAHFLGVDHAGHIFGVDSAPMTQKLEQYNAVLERVVEVLFNHSGPGDVHENTLLVVMGDHGQTVNGDHGGGTPEEVETALFALSLKSPPDIASSIPESDSCGLNVEGESICVGSIQQIDFAATIAALLGVPFPFGSIGRVNADLYALTGGTWQERAAEGHRSTLELWMRDYMNNLCINCWQVKRYIDLYSATSVVGFSPEDLMHFHQMYNHVQANWTDTMKSKSAFDGGSPEELIPIFQRQIDAYWKFLEAIAALARSKWTEFDLVMMDSGLLVLFTSIMFHIYCIMQSYRSLESVSLSGSGYSSFLTSVALLLLAIRASSFLSNSYILAEGNVANFLLGSAVIISFRSSIIAGKNMPEDVAVLILNTVLRFRFEAFLKQMSGLTHMVQEILPIVLLSFLAILVYLCTSTMFCWSGRIVFVLGTIFSYIFIGIHWVSESNLIEMPILIRNVGKVYLPRAIYTIGMGQLLFAIAMSSRDRERLPANSKRISAATAAMLCSWSSTILILLGRQGSFVFLLSWFGAWCIIRLQKQQVHDMHGVVGGILVKPISVMQWNLLAVCLFFYTGHWCAFDGLRYGAAFIGFDQFNLLRQGFLLAVDTFGSSHILPILGLPLLAIFNDNSKSDGTSRMLYLNLSSGFLVYGFITAITTSFMVVCVRIQRRHLMVWGLFAPKYVFDVVGLVLTDVLVFFASIYYL